MLPSEGPDGGEPRRSTMKYMADGERVQRREKEKSSRRGGDSGIGSARGWGRVQRPEGGGIPRIQVIQRRGALSAGETAGIMIQLPAGARSVEVSEGAAGGLVGEQGRAV